MEIVTQLWPELRQGSKKLPLPTPISLTRAMLSSLNPHDYAVGCKNDGIRAVAVLCFDNQSNFITLINRKGHEFFQRFAGSSEEEIWNGTLLDIEVMPDKTWVLLDVIAMNGYSTIMMDFQTRLGKVNPTVITLLRRFNIDLRLKKWLPLDQLEELNISNGCDGLIFMPLSEKVRIGRHSRMFKWKPKHTIDLIWKYGTANYMSNNGLNPISLNIEFQKLTPMDGKIYEFEILPNASSCRLLMERTDKHIPNFKTTVENCIQCANENLTYDELKVQVKIKHIM